jgi:flagellar motor switch protein FliM
MPEDMSVLRRKLRSAAVPDAEQVPGAFERTLPRALARIAEAQMRLALKVTHLSDAHAAPADLVAGLDPGALITMLDGDAGAGLAVLDPGAVQVLIEVLTTGRVGAGPAPDRIPTPTDAVIAAPFMDAVLAEVSATAGALRMGRMVGDPRPLPLYLGEGALRVVRVTMEAGEGPVREGQLMIAFAEAAPPFAEQAADAQVRRPEEQGWEGRLEKSVMIAETSLDAILARVSLPLDTVLGLTVGSEIPLPPGTIDRVRIEGRDGVQVLCGRLGQSRGHRAVRILRDRTGTGESPAGAATGIARADDGSWAEVSATDAPISAILAPPAESEPVATT